MVQDRDDAEKTEEPTEKRLADAAAKGEVPKSQELVQLASLLGVATVLALLLAPSGRAFLVLFEQHLGAPDRLEVTGEGLLRHLSGLSAMLALALALPVGVLVAAPLLGHLLQHRPHLSGERLMPDLAKISPFKGAARLLSPDALFTGLRGFVKVFAIALLGVVLVWPARHELAGLTSLAPAAWLGLALRHVLELVGGTLAVLAALALVDVAYQRWSFRRRLRMSRQEVKEELRQAEGDPHVRARLRAIRAERGRARMMAQVPKASVVITNPTHVAVALAYESGKMNAPVCVAKGLDHLALRIRAIAGEHGVPMVENPPLARALHASVEVDEEIPSEHYQAVAQVIGYVMRLRGAVRGPRPPRAR